MLTALPAQAAVKTKTVDVVTYDYTDSKELPSLSKLKNKITRVKKGKTKLLIRSGFLSFKAPSAGKYTFTFYGLDTRGGYGSVSFLKRVGSSKLLSYIKNRYVKTAGGRNSVLWLCTKAEAPYYEKDSSIKKIARPLIKRSGTIKLAKGEKVYLYLDFPLTEEDQTRKTITKTSDGRYVETTPQSREVYAKLTLKVAKVK